MIEKNKFLKLIMITCCMMVLQSTGAISFSDIQTEFGGTNPIGMDEYYNNAGSGYTNGISGIPNIGSAISLSHFYGKSKNNDPLLYSGNKSANLDTTGYSSILNNSDDSYVLIGIDFPFYFLGTDYGTGNTIWWNTNHAITFGNYSSTYQQWTASTARGILLGQMDRYTNSLYSIAKYTSSSYTIKRIVLYSTDYADKTKLINWEIRFIKGSNYQYIELSISAMTSTNNGYLWCGSDMTNFFDIFNVTNYTTKPIGVGESLVLRSDLTGNNWQCFKNYYMNI